MKCLLALVLMGSAVCAQVSLTSVTSFTHPVFAGNGTIGVCTDSLTGDIWVVDFSNAVNLQRFDLAGTLLSSHATNTCTPAMTSPNDLTQDRLTGDLWLVDNDSGGSVLRFSTAGTCLGGFTLGGAYSNPVAIASNTLTNNLVIGHTGSVAEYTQAGVLVGTPFSTAAGGIAGIVSGLTHIPSSNHYLAASGSNLYEWDASGNQIQVINMATFGVGNIQAVDYDPLSGRVTVADNSTVTIHVFQDSGQVAEYMLNQAEASFSLNGVQGTSFVPASVTINAGQTALLSAASILVGSPFELAYGAAPLRSVSQGALVSIDAQIFNVDTTDPNFSLLFNGFLSPPFVPINFPAPFAFPAGFSFQMAVLDPTVPSNLRLSQPVRLDVL
jgi:hypothetical protein